MGWGLRVGCSLLLPVWGGVQDLGITSIFPQSISLLSIRKHVLQALCSPVPREKCWGRYPS